jgi:hypothetical protein
MKQIAKALIEAQKEMGNAVKDSINPFFKSKYADLNSIREACIPALNKNAIVVLQPIIQVDGKSFVKTLLMHESGEIVEGLTEIIYSKQNDAQAQGSGITYARRYGLQSLICIGAEDDDGQKAVEQPKNNSQETKKVIFKAPDDARAGGENFFKQFKAKLESCISDKDIDELWLKTAPTLKRLEDNKNTNDLFVKLEECEDFLKKQYQQGAAMANDALLPN